MRQFLVKYLIPTPPARISVESSEAMAADLAEANLGVLADEHRSKIDVWTRHADELARRGNREWLRAQGWVFVRRWAILALVLWVCAYASSGQLWSEVPFTLGAVVASFGTLLMFWLRREAHLDLPRK